MGGREDAEDDSPVSDALSHATIGALQWVSVPGKRIFLDRRDCLIEQAAVFCVHPFQLIFGRVVHPQIPVVFGPRHMVPS